MQDVAEVLEIVRHRQNFAKSSITNATSTLDAGLTPFLLTAALTPSFRSHRRATTAPGPRVSLRRTTRGGCSRWRRQCGSCSLRRRRSGRRSSTRARSTLCSRLVTTDQGMLRTKELLDAADIGKLRPRWDGPFTVTACPSPNAYTLALPCRMRCSPTVNVDRLKPFVDRAGASPAPGPVSARDRKGSTRWSCCSTAGRCAVVTRYLVRFAGSHVGGRLVAAVGGAGALPSEGDEERRRCP